MHAVGLPCLQLYRDSSSVSVGLSNTQGHGGMFTEHLFLLQSSTNHY